VRARLLLTAQAVSAALLLTAAGQAQTVEGAPAVVPADEREQIFFLIIPAGFEHQFQTNIDDGGRFRVTRANVSLNLRMPITPDINTSFLFSYGYDRYRFSGTTGFGGMNPWGDIHTLNFGAIFSGHLDEDWMLFGGPVFQIARESGADWSDGFIGGGVGGAIFRVSDDLRIGGGIGAVSQIKDSVRIFPVIVLDWRIAPQLRLTSETAVGGAGDSGIELIYELGGGLEVALGGGYRFRRFRLDDDPPAVDGVGQDRYIPLWARLGWDVNPNITVNVYGGASLGGRLQLDNSAGTTISRQDYDPAGIVGITGTVRF
jgi:opacity protein-like surface antigen